MKRILTFIICLSLIGFTAFKFNYFVDYIIDYLSVNKPIIFESENEYAKHQDYDFVKITKDFTPYSYQDLLNIFYTTLDAGYEKLIFYCPSEYENCINDVAKISNEKNIDVLTTIGNYVSPFNNFKSLKVEYDTTGEVTINIKHLYTAEEINKINNKIDEIYNEIITNDMSKEKIINTFHDYIINNTKYDSIYEKELPTGTTTHDSSKANGPLFEGYAICSGYTDLMAIILDKIDIKNFKVASTSHVWNAVYINDKWSHLDLTWDDPVSNMDIDTLLHKFYLISTKELEEFNIDDHEYNKTIYTEIK